MIIKLYKLLLIFIVLANIILKVIYFKQINLLRWLDISTPNFQIVGVNLENGWVVIHDAFQIWFRLSILKAFQAFDKREVVVPNVFEVSLFKELDSVDKFGGVVYPKHVCQRVVENFL